MNEILEMIRTRRSVKRYKPDNVPEGLIDQVIEAGLYAPSGLNRQETIIVAVTDPETRDRLSRANASVMGMDSDPFYGAPAVLVVLAKKDCMTGLYDGSLVMSNLMLAAHALGLGSSWIHRAKETFEMPEWKQWLRSIGVEGEYEGVGNCILGYAADAPAKDTSRKPDRVFKVR